MRKAKYSRVLYNDDGIEVPGILVRRWLRRPLFLPFHIGCGFDSQAIYRTDQSLLQKMNDENLVSEHLPEICPVCNNLSLKYSKRRDFVGMFDYPWECQCCGTSGAESYSVRFMGHVLISVASDRKDHS